MNKEFQNPKTNFEDPERTEKPFKSPKKRGLKKRKNAKTKATNGTGLETTKKPDDKTEPGLTETGDMTDRRPGLPETEDMTDRRHGLPETDDGTTDRPGLPKTEDMTDRPGLPKTEGTTERPGLHDIEKLDISFSEEEILSDFQFVSLEESLETQNLLTQGVPETTSIACSNPEVNPPSKDLERTTKGPGIEKLEGKETEFDEGDLSHAKEKEIDSKLPEASNQENVLEEALLSEECSGQSFVGKMEAVQEMVESLPEGRDIACRLQQATDAHQFWTTQPVPHILEIIEEVNECIEADKSPEEIRQEPYSLPNGFCWDSLDTIDSNILQELVDFLNENYVDDKIKDVQFNLTPDLIRWLIQPPGWLKFWHLGVRVAKNRKLVGFICAVPMSITVYSRQKLMAKVNFLCVHKKLRLRRMTPVLIREMTRRVNLLHVFQAVHSSSTLVPKPVSRIQLLQRPLNPHKLSTLGLFNFKPTATERTLQRLYRVPYGVAKGIRYFHPNDTEVVYSMLCKYLQQFDLHPNYSMEEFIHWFRLRPGLVYSFVYEDRKTHKITGFISFFASQSTIYGHGVYKKLKNANCFYCIDTEEPFHYMMQEALIIANYLEFDMFSLLNVMYDEASLKRLRFSKALYPQYYYIYNWKCPPIIPKRIGLVLH